MARAGLGAPPGRVWRAGMAGCRVEVIVCTGRFVCDRWRARGGAGGRAHLPGLRPDGGELEVDGDVDSDTCRPPGFKPGLPPALRRRRTVVRSFASSAQRRPVHLKELHGRGTQGERSEKEHANARAYYPGHGHGPSAVAARTRCALSQARGKRGWAVLRGKASRPLFWGSAEAH